MHTAEWIKTSKDEGPGDSSNYRITLAVFHDVQWGAWIYANSAEPKNSGHLRAGFLKCISLAVLNKLGKAMSKCGPRLGVTATRQPLMLTQADKNAFAASSDVGQGSGTAYGQLVKRSTQKSM